MTLTPRPPAYTPAQARIMRQTRKARAATATNPKLAPASLADERRYVKREG